MIIYISREKYSNKIKMKHCIICIVITKTKSLNTIIRYLPCYNNTTVNNYNSHKNLQKYLPLWEVTSLFYP